MINKLISVYRVIAKVYTDLGITESNVPITDMIEWSAEAIEKIGAFRFYKKLCISKKTVPQNHICDCWWRTPGTRTVC